MSIVRATAARIRCSHTNESGRCPSVLHVDADLDDEQVREAARERGWGALEPRMQGGPVFGGSGTPDFPVADDDRDLCPRHRGES